MRILTPGHRYVANNFEQPGNGQTIQFIEKAPALIGPPDLVTINDGTTNEEVIKVLIDRLHFLQDKFPCRENEHAIEHIGAALAHLNNRTADREARKVEGKNLA